MVYDPKHFIYRYRRFQSAALLGYSWFGCTNGQTQNPRAKEWDMDFGEPVDPYCHQVGTSGVWTRQWSKAAVTWDCNAGHGQITPSA